MGNEEQATPPRRARQQAQAPYAERPLLAAQAPYAERYAGPAPDPGPHAGRLPYAGPTPSAGPDAGQPSGAAPHAEEALNAEQAANATPYAGPPHDEPHAGPPPYAGPTPHAKRYAGPPPHDEPQAGRLPYAGPTPHAKRYAGPASDARAMTHAERALRHVAGLAGGRPLDPGLRVTLNFHPDRTAAGRPILRALAEDGTYFSQFVTGTGNGGLTAHPGGARWAWESRIFAGAYDDAPAHARPVYGALNFRGRPTGAAPRFGSAHFRLTAAVLPRTTFCYPDSFFEPSHFGVAAAMSLIGLALADAKDALDDYIEAQVHGPVVIGPGQVEALVLDPCYRGTEVEAAARRLACPLEWHPGFRLSVEELRRHPEYRGPEFVDLGAAIAVDGRLDPRVIGAAARTGRYDEQALKRVWHCVARYGSPPDPPDPPDPTGPPDPPAASPSGD